MMGHCPERLRGCSGRELFLFFNIMDLRMNIALLWPVYNTICRHVYRGTCWICTCIYTESSLLTTLAGSSSWHGGWNTPSALNNPHRPHSAMAWLEVSLLKALLPLHRTVFAKESSLRQKTSGGTLGGYEGPCMPIPSNSVHLQVPTWQLSIICRLLPKQQM